MSAVPLWERLYGRRAQVLPVIPTSHPQWRGDAATTRTIHTWLRTHFPKSGRCDECGREAKTDYAFRHHPNSYTRVRSDYRELCRRCHVIADEHPIIQRQTHCKRGHELTDGNVRVSGGRRWCLACKRASGRRAQKRYLERQRQS